MRSLSIQTLTMPAADLGPENPLPHLASSRTAKKVDYPPGFTDDILENLAYGSLSSFLPYTFQDGFNRQLKSRDFQVAILENEILRATFLLEFGGRLWSLVHKLSGRELLEVNPVFQLANLAIRNAWFSGGVEWNIGTLGHSPFTCSPLFACRIEGSNGMPILRMYEWERFRNTPFQIDAYLPEGSPVLFIHTRIINPNDTDVPIYWWSNIAVPETPHTRVLVPAEAAYCLGCRPDYLERVPVPENNGVDFTYSMNMIQAADFFFDLQDNQYPWIAALDESGQGLVQISTKEMIGRKLWVWGTGSGGRNWQRFLSPPGKGYIEIQSGLTKTQLEHKRLPQRTSISWLEAYGYLEANPRIIHGVDWIHAYQHVDSQLRKVISEEDLAREHDRSKEFLDSQPLEFFQKGSGWGALESRRQAFHSENPWSSNGLIFGEETLTEDQEPWLSLLETGTFPSMDENTSICTFSTGENWGDLIEQALGAKSSDNWYAWYQAGVVRHHAGDSDGARKAWRRSLLCSWSPWATRNLGILTWQAGQTDIAADLLVEAFQGTPSILPLAVECGACLNVAGRYEEWLLMVQKFPASMKSNGRIRLLAAQAALANGDLSAVERFFKDEVAVADIREGDNSISDLWIDYQVQRMCRDENLTPDHPRVYQFRKHCSVPDEIDFRMQEN